MKKILPALITGLLLSTTAQADEGPVTAQKLSDHVYVLFGQGGNIAASVGDDGIYIIDDQFAKLSDDIKKTISDLKPGSAEFVINTHHHGDHTGGNENFAKAGAHVIAHDNVHKRLEEQHGEGSDFYYMGNVTPIDDSFEETTIKNDNGNDVPVVKVKFTMNTPVEEGIYNYLTEEIKGIIND